MNGIRLIGFLALGPTAVLLTISFFVLVVIRKLESQGLKAFGYVVTALLWLAALVVFSTGVYVISTGRSPGICAMQQMMAGHMAAMMQGKDQGMMSPGAMPGQK